MTKAPARRPSADKPTPNPPKPTPTSKEFFGFNPAQRAGGGEYAQGYIRKNEVVAILPRVVSGNTTAQIVTANNSFDVTKDAPKGVLTSLGQASAFFAVTLVSPNSVGYVRKAGVLRVIPDVVKNIPNKSRIVLLNGREIAVKQSPLAILGRLA